jgi:hypothetical protein
MVLVSLFVGLGITEVLTGVTRIIRSRDTVQTYWIHSLFMVIIFVALLRQWWEIWGVRDVPVWTFPGLVMMLAGPIGLFLVANLLFPESVSGTDFRKYYYNKMRPVLWIGLATVLLAVTFRPLVLGTKLLALVNLSSFVVMGIFVSLMLTRKSWFHGIMVTILLGGMLADIMLAGIEIK